MRKINDCDTLTFQMPFVRLRSIVSLYLVATTEMILKVICVNGSRPSLATKTIKNTYLFTQRNNAHPRAKDRSISPPCVSPPCQSITLPSHLQKSIRFSPNMSDISEECIPAIRCMAPTHSHSQTECLSSQPV